MFRRGRKGHDADEMSIHTKTVINNAQRENGGSNAGFLSILSVRDPSLPDTSSIKTFPKPLLTLPCDLLRNENGSFSGLHNAVH